MRLVLKETQNFIKKFREIFSWRETVLRAHRMKSDDKKLISCQIYVIFLEKMVHVVIDRYFSSYLMGFEDFLNLILSLIVPLMHLQNSWLRSHHHMRGHMEVLSLFPNGDFRTIRTFYPVQKNRKVHFFRKFSSISGPLSECLWHPYNQSHNMPL